MERSDCAVVRRVAAIDSSSRAAGTRMRGILPWLDRQAMLEVADRKRPGLRLEVQHELSPESSTP
jgi:hypothetical protein